MLDWTADPRNGNSPGEVFASNMLLFFRLDFGADFIALFWNGSFPWIFAWRESCQRSFACPRIHTCLNHLPAMLDPASFSAIPLANSLGRNKPFHTGIGVAYMRLVRHRGLTYSRSAFCFVHLRLADAGASRHCDGSEGLIGVVNRQKILSHV